MRPLRYIFQPEPPAIHAAMQPFGLAALEFCLTGYTCSHYRQSDLPSAGYAPLRFQMQPRRWRAPEEERASCYGCSHAASPSRTDDSSRDSAAAAEQQGTIRQPTNPASTSDSRARRPPAPLLREKNALKTQAKGHKTAPNKPENSVSPLPQRTPHAAPSGPREAKGSGKAERQPERRRTRNEGNEQVLQRNHPPAFHKYGKATCRKRRQQIRRAKASVHRRFPSATWQGSREWRSQG